MITITDGVPSFRARKCRLCWKDEPLNEITFVDKDGNGQIIHVCNECLERMKKAIDKRIKENKRKVD